MLIPPAWSVGLDPLHPLFVPAERITTASDGVDPRMEVLEVQVPAREDLIDDIKSFMVHVFFPQIEEELIRVRVPNIEPKEIRTNVDTWRQWVTLQEKKGATVPGEVTDMINKMELWIRYTDQSRLLRHQVARFAGGLFSEQEELTFLISEWLNKDVIEKYDEYRSQTSSLILGKLIWDAAQYLYRDMSDISSMPWCHRDGFTTPIYSMNDIWNTARQNRSNPLDMEYYRVPSLESAQRGRDCLFDFTTLKIGTGSIRFPVLDPIEVRMKLVDPPAIDAETVAALELPDLPPLPEFEDEHIESFFPEILTGAGLPMWELPKGLENVAECQLYDASQLSQITSNVLKIYGMLYGMKDEYEKMWQSTVRLPPSSELEAKQDCYEPHKETCVHHELDLRERFQRLTSRPAVILKEDFFAIGKPRPRSGIDTESAGPAKGFTIQSCPPDDWACIFLNQQAVKRREGPGIIWDGTVEEAPTDFFCDFVLEGEPLDRARACEFNRTLFRFNVDPDEHFPYDQSRQDTIPSFSIPEPIELIPESE